MPEYLVTGVAGFIGRSIAAALLARGAAVRGVDNFLTGRRSNLVGLEHLEFFEGDITDPEVAAQVCAGVKVIFHEAALPSVPRSVAEPMVTNEHCVNATLALLLAARDQGVRRLIYAGSSAVYGDSVILPQREDLPTKPESPYAVAKLAGEHYVNVLARLYGLETVVLRYFNVFGPYQDPDSYYTGVLTIFCRQMLLGERVSIYGDGEQSRDFTYIDNVVHGNLLAAEAPASRVSGKVINLACGTRVTLNEAFSELAAITSYHRQPAYDDARPGDIRHSLADITLARELLGYKPLVSFREGIRSALKWYRGAVMSV